MMHGRGTAPIGGTSRPLHTPQPPRVPALTPGQEISLTYKPSQKPWAKLLWGPETSTFAQKDRSVKIYAAQQIPVSPTHYPGQSTEWFHTDQDSLYRVMKRVIQWKVDIFETQASVPHTNLLPTRPTRNTRPGAAVQLPRDRYPMNTDAVVYLKEAIFLDINGVRTEVRKNTGVTLSRAVSRLQRPNDRIWNTNPLNMHYIVQVYVLTYKWKWQECNKAIPIARLGQLTTDEINALNSKPLLRSKLVSADTVPSRLRFQDACQVEENEE